MQSTEEWTDAETEQYDSRLKVLLRGGVSQADAEKLAIDLLHRDRPGSGDDRRICFECKGLKGRVCGFAERLGLRRGMEPLRTVLQRCDGFQLRGAKAAEELTT